MPTEMTCGECRDTLDALIDGELLPDEAEKVQRHLAGCGACAAEHRMLTRLSTLLRDGAVAPRAPDVLKARIRSELGRTVVDDAPARPRAPWKLIAAGLVIAAVSASTGWLAARRGPAATPVAGEILSSHIRSLMPGHLTDVTSTNLHNVKPWFNGRIDLSPSVPSLDSAGFPLLGGRLDYVRGRSVAVVVYSRRQHLINVYSWPTSGRAMAPEVITEQGYHLVHWVSAGAEYWAASDLGVGELSRFVALFSRE